MMYLNHRKYIFFNIIGKQGGNYSQKKTCAIDNILICNREKNANEFNNFFISIGHTLAKYITCNVNTLFYVNSVNDSIVVQYVYIYIYIYCSRKKCYHIPQ